MTSRSRKRRRLDDLASVSTPPALGLAGTQDGGGLRGQRQLASIHRDPAIPVRTLATLTTAQTPEPSSSAALRTLGETDQESSHIVGPVVANDAEMLQSYLSVMGSTAAFHPTIRPSPYALYSKGPNPVLCTTIRKQPVGVVIDKTPGFDQCQVIERLVEPFAGDLIDLYFEKLNACLPLLDESSFRKQYNNDKEKIPRALLANLYACTLIFWKHSPTLSEHHCPNIRYVWIKASETLHAESLLSPGMSTIIAILLNVGGRPTTTMTGNAMALGSAVALAHSLGLNRDPSRWDLSEQEKDLRIRIWWSLFIHDTWYGRCSYGTHETDMLQV